MLAMRLFFWDAWPPKPPPTGQSPRGSRYRSGDRFNYILRGILLIIGV